MPRSLRVGARLAELGACRDARIELQKIQALFIALGMHSADEHAARVDTHHLARRKVSNGNERLAHQILGLVVA
mgnify:CR=1 FL=1